MSDQTNAQDIWYYSAGEQSLGPVDFAQLRRIFQEQKLAANTLVWEMGMADWQAAASIPGLVAQVEPSASTGQPTPALEEPVATPASSAPGAPVEKVTAIPASSQPFATPPRTNWFTPPVAAASGLLPAQRNRRIFFIITAGIAILAILLPWGYRHVPSGSSARSIIVMGMRLWEAIACAVLGLAALGAAITDLSASHSHRVQRTTRWLHLLFFMALTIIAEAGGMLLILHPPGVHPAGTVVLPLAPVIVFILAAVALVLSVRECMGA